MELNSPDEQITDSKNSNRTSNENEYSDKEIKLTIDSTDVNTKSKFVSNLNNKDGAKDKSVFGFFGDESRRPQYWVLLNFGTGGRQIPPGGGPALDYDGSRNSFVKVVFTIVLIMLLCTCGLVSAVLFVEPVKELFQSLGMMLMIPAVIGMIALNYAMACSACTRSTPCNYICLILAVIFMSIITAYITSRYRTQLIFFGLIVTIVVVLVCIALACSSFDFTKFLLYVVAIAVVFSVITMIYLVVTLIMKQYFKIIHLIILIVGSILNVVFLIMELQMILGGRAVELSEDDYALGAFMLYTSIVDLFLKLVQIMGIFDSDSDW